MSFAEIAQLVERNLAKVEVAGPSPVFRSRKKRIDCSILFSFVGQQVFLGRVKIYCLLIILLHFYRVYSTGRSGMAPF